MSEAKEDPTSELRVMETCAKALSGLDEASRKRALGWLSQHFAVETPPDPGGGGSGVGRLLVDPTHDGSSVRTMSAKEFVVSKRPQTEVERMTVLAYYRLHNRGESTFTTADLTALNTEAAQPKLSNPSQIASNATKSSHYFAAAGSGTRQLTTLGERVVEAMPDREAMQAAIRELGRPRRRPTKKASQKSAE
jgi:hypothetical protein